MGFQPGRVGPEPKLLSILHLRYISAEMSLKGSADITSISATSSSTAGGNVQDRQECSGEDVLGPRSQALPCQTGS